MSEPPACSVFDLRLDAPDYTVFRSPATPFGACRVSAKNASSFHASRRSRKLGTAFRSPVTTLSPPLRGQRSRPAPSLPRRNFFANPFDRKLLRSVWFRSRNRANSSPSTRCPRRFPALSWLRPISTPLRVVSTLRIKAFNRLHHNKLAKPDARLSFAPRNALFRFRCGSKLETRFVLPSYRSVNPGTESIMHRRRVLVNLKYDGSATLSSGFLRLIFSELRRCPGGFHVHKSALAESVSRSRSEPWRIRVAEMHQRWWLTVPQRCHGAFMFSMICDPQALAAQLRIKHARWVRTQT